MGIDISKNMLSLAKKRDPKSEVFLMDMG